MARVPGVGLLNRTCKSWVEKARGSTPPRASNSKDEVGRMKDESHNLGALKPSQSTKLSEDRGQRSEIRGKIVKACRQSKPTSGRKPKTRNSKSKLETRNDIRRCSSIG